MALSQQRQDAQRDCFWPFAAKPYVGFYGSCWAISGLDASGHKSTRKAHSRHFTSERQGAIKQCAVAFPARTRNRDFLIRANPARAFFPSKTRTGKSAVESNRRPRRRDGIDKRHAPTKSAGLSLIVKDAGR